METNTSSRTSPDSQPGHAERGAKNTATLGQPNFKTACDDAGIEVTRRQASKWNSGKGKAYKTANHIHMNGVSQEA